MPYGTINVDKVIDTDGGVLAPISSVFRNRIINGAMVIDQRNAGATKATPAGSNYYTDRWNATINTPTGTIGQSTTAPTGFKNSLALLVTTGGTISSNINFISQSIEGFNIYDLSWGTAQAKTITLSFQVYTSVAGTFGGSLRNASANRSYPFTYSIPLSNTWTTISITIAGDTTGTWATDNSIGMTVFFDLGSGAATGTAGAWAGANYIGATGTQTGLMTTNGATFYITGVQLEKGSTATSFDYRPYGTELALCQRYGQLVTQQQNSGDVCGSGANTNVKFQFPVTMRSAPTASLVTAGSWIVGNGYSANYTASSVSIAGQALSTQGGRVAIGGFSSFGSNFFVSGSDAVGTAVMFMSSEL